MRGTQKAITTITVAVAIAFSLMLGAGIPATAYAVEGEEVVDTQTDELDVAVEGTNTSGSQSGSQSGTQSGSGSSTSKTKVTSTPSTGSTTSKTSTPSTGDATTNVLPICVTAVASVGAGLVLHARSRKE